MTTNLQPIHLWGHWGAPNPWKVKMILEELGLPHTMTIVEFDDAKKPEYLAVNPNGRLPSIRDPNTGITLWESAAIIQYLIDQYDTEGKLSYKTFPDKYHCQQWLAFQISGQGPYFGQAAWFLRFHPEKIQSAIDRYVNEMLRVLGVLNTALETNGTGWLVGDKCTYADLSFVTWASHAYSILAQIGKLDALEQFPQYNAWLERLNSRPVVSKLMQEVASNRTERGFK